MSRAYTTTLISANSIGYALWFLKESKSNEFTTIEFDNKNDKPVAYIEGQENTKYTSIKKALDVAEHDSNNNTIYVIPGTNPIIEGKCLVASGDTLVFPYDGTTWQDSERNTVTNDNFADSSLDHVNQNRKNLITLKNDATLINEGTIQIGGIIGTSTNKSRQRPTGHTVGNYVELRMEEQSKLLNYGNITCYGYIKPNKIFTINSDNQPVIENIGPNASLTLPLVIYDYKGANFSLGAVGTTIMPFNIFDFPNSQVKMIFDNQSCLNTTVTLYSPGFPGVMEEGIQTETLKLIDQADAIFICKDGAIEMKYNSSKYENGEFFTIDDSSTDTISENFNKTQVNIKGNFEFSSTQMKLAGLLPINTADYYLPFSYKYDINIISGESNIKSKLKFLKGSSLTINQSGTLNINSNVSFYSTYVDQSQYAEQKYPRDVSQALLINNGTLNIKSGLSGFITSQSDNAIINISSDVNLVTSVDELLDASRGSGIFELRMTATYRTVNGVAYGYIANSDDFSDPILCSFSNNSRYFSNSEGIRSGLQGNSDINESISNDKTKKFRLTDLVDISCFDEKTTLITNQGKKSIKDIKENDEVLTFNHFENKFEMQKIILKISHKERLCNSIKLNFENNYTITVINSHGFFNAEENKYISINQNNVDSYINKNFLIHKDNKLSKVKLLSYETTRENKKSYAIITNKNYNAVCNNLLNVTDITDALYNLFPYDKNHCYNKEMVNHIIKKYGYLKYDHFKNLISEDLFNAFNGKYFIQKFISGYMNIDLLTKYLEILQKYNELGEVEFATYFN